MLTEQGFERLPRIIDAAQADAARETIFRPGAAGTRCLLDHPMVREIVGSARRVLVDTGHLPTTAVAIQAISFDKTPDANWKVTWHQDLMFPFARPVQAGEYTLPTLKDGVHYARPPRAVLEALLAVRIHLDDCDATNGPLRVSPATHRRGVIPSADLLAAVAQHGETTCLAQTADALLMRPLLVHASSPAIVPKHRRVLHLVFHTGEPIPEPWHRAV